MVIDTKSHYLVQEWTFWTAGREDSSIGHASLFELEKLEVDCRTIGGVFISCCWCLEQPGELTAGKSHAAQLSCCSPYDHYSEDSRPELQSVHGAC